MTDPMAAPPAPPAPASNMQMPTFMASMGRAELFIFLGAALIVLDDVIFGIFGAYGFSNVAWIVAVGSLLLIFLNGRMFGFSAATVRSLLLLLGMVAVLIGIRELLSDLVFIPGRNLDITFWLGALALYAGVALMGFGAWLLWGRKTA